MIKSKQLTKARRILNQYERKAPMILKRVVNEICDGAKFVSLPDVSSLLNYLTYDTSNADDYDLINTVVDWSSSISGLLLKTNVQPIYYAFEDDNGILHEQVIL